MASSSSSSRNWVYDVFPSFSGEDVRVTFLSHFLKELDRKLIISFKDNEIERSQSLDPELKQAIRTSRIAVVVFSEKYASSSWCLDELLEIVNCKEELDQLIIPVFYGLDPSHVRKQTGNFGEAFAKTCQRKTEDESKLWRQSLTDVASLLGYHSQNWPNEAKMIEAIANDILAKLNLAPSKDFEDFVGMEDHIANMSVLLHLESDEVRMVGIWGTSGSGKTSIARVLYNQLSRQFQGRIFIDRAFVSKSLEIYKSANPDDYNMKLHLLRNFLSEILDKKDIRISCLGAVEERLKHQKVLIFIDDLDDQVVLDTLVGQTQWFGSGSRIILVTKDKHFLRAHGIDHIYEVCLPSQKLALEMFSRYAFRQNFPPDGLIELASEVALCAGNLPLGLKVLGSYLRGRDKEDLMDMLPRLRNGLDGKIEKTLRLSYDGLNDKKDKAILRHIACLFNGEKVSNIKLLLAHSGLDVNIGLKNLVEKSLIYVREGIVEMHSLLQEMGKEIVRAQSNEPGEREFLMDSKDICDLLEDNTGTKKIIGISLDMDETDELRIHESAFKEMRNLLFLEIYTKEWYQQRLTTRKSDQKKEVRWHLPEGFDYLPHKLRLLRLDDYPRRCMPSNFCPQNLVKLQMQGSKLERLWEGVHTLGGLKKIDLKRSIHLKEIPDLSMATNLETLDLSDCSSLVELPSSIQYLNKLEQLIMSGCSNVETLPNGINLQSLDTLDLQGCSRLNIFPDISTNISVLLIKNTCIEEITSHLCLMNLTVLRIMNENFWKTVQPLTPLMAMLPHTLGRLFLSDIPSLVEIPSSIQNFTKLDILQITDCINLETLPTGINLHHLYTLNLSGCSRLDTFPNISTNIRQLLLQRTGIEEVPWWIEKFTKLTYMTMEKCNNLVRVSLNIYKLKQLTAEFSGCGSLTEASWNGSPSEVAIATDNIHSKFPIQGLDEAFSYHPSYYQRKVGFTFKFLNLDPEAILHNQSIIFNSMILLGEEVPSYFTHQSIGSGESLTNIPLLHTSLSQQFFKFRACAVVVFDSKPINSGNAIHIHVNCRFKDRFGNSFDSSGQLHDFYTPMTDSHLFILDCRIPLNDVNAPLAQGNYDHVDMQIHIKKIWQGPLYMNDSKLTFNGWGIRLLEESSSLENRLSNSNTIPHVCEAGEDNLVNKTEHREECVETTVVKRQRETGSESRLREAPLKKPLLFPASDTQEEHKTSL
ncbi:PREDICTED: disease resistance protein RPS6-like [Camelina sativa]|uniref:ADP-ribosyl cyclase/cyclic ADP-ribose hydrolase n=1 Tax=Camelina sativa TaxID=90675 RepID=A0ABM0Y3D9_CAMSA|nr:PREDICTED: disease resistance protein RPS6-like [Camelina sativa]